jgi:Yip1 domain
LAADSVWTIAVNIFTSPREAFAAIRERPRFWLPLVLVVLASSATAAIYLMGVDVEWFYGEQLRNSGRNMTEEQIEQATRFMTSLPSPVLGAIGAMSAMIFLPILYLLSALYYRIVSGFTKDGVRYAQWFGLVCWCALPALLAQIATGVNLLTNDISLMPQSDVNPLSIPNLLGMELSAGSPLAGIAAYLDPTTIWTTVLTVIGYRTWTGKSLFVSILVVITPLVLIFGLLAAR